MLRVVLVAHPVDTGGAATVPLQMIPGDAEGALVGDPAEQRRGDSYQRWAALLDRPPGLPAVAGHEVVTVAAVAARPFRVQDIDLGGRADLWPPVLRHQSPPRKARGKKRGRSISGLLPP